MNRSTNYAGSQFIISRFFLSMINNFIDQRVNLNREIKAIQ